MQQRKQAPIRRVPRDVLRGRLLHAPRDGLGNLPPGWHDAGARLRHCIRHCLLHMALLLLPYGTRYSTEAVATTA